jgi:hypothetical protein
MNLTELENAVSKMTPGPWSYADRGHGSCIQPCELWVGDCSSLPRNQHRHDSSGIVALRNAAPDLIAAAKERDELAAMLRECAENCYMPDERRKRIDAALAKGGGAC